MAVFNGNLSQLTVLQRIAYVLRKLHLLQFADNFWFFRIYWMNYKINIRFRKEYPKAHVPPPMVLYDIQGNCNLYDYYIGGQKQAHEISKIISSERLDQSLNILEWGCGPARIIQHLESPDGKSWQLWGSDYNPQSISWCQQHFTKINFIHNDLEPPIAFEDSYFNVIYCISVFTHLSEARHYQWIDEIYRLLKPGGLFIGTFRSEWFKKDLTFEEQLRFDKGEMIIRDKIKEGKKDYAAYHSDSFVTGLLSSFSDTKKMESVSNFVQTVWIASK